MFTNDKGFIKAGLVIGAIALLVIVGATRNKQREQALNEFQSVEVFETIESTSPAQVEEESPFSTEEIQEEQGEGSDTPSASIPSGTLELTPPSPKVAMVDSDTAKIVVSEEDFNTIIQANLQADSDAQELSITDLSIDIKDGVSELHTSWDEGQELVAIIAPSEEGTKLVIADVQVVGAGIFNSVFESVSAGLLENMLNSFTEQTEGQLELIEMKEDSLIMYYSI